MSRWIALVCASLSILMALRSEPHDAVFAVSGLNLVALSMIFRPGWWTFWMPLGFLEQMASDKSKADSLGPVIVVGGWIALLLVLVLSLRI